MKSCKKKKEKYYHVSVFEGGMWTVRHSGTLQEMRDWQTVFELQGYPSVIRSNV